MKHHKYIRSFFMAMLLYLLPCTVAVAYTVELTREEVQEVVAGHFPVKHVTPLVMLTAHNPQVSLKQKSGRIGLAVSVLANVPGILSGEGRALIDGDLEYRAKTGEFYLRDPKIKNLELYGFPADIIRSIRHVLQQMMRQSLPVMLVYKLQDDDLKQKMAKSVLSSVTVREGKLILELSVPLLNVID